VPIHRDIHIDLKTEKGGVVKGYKTKAKTKRKRNRRPEAKESICQGLSPVPIHRDTQIDLKTESEV
jgi:hypothetical protein